MRVDVRAVLALVLLPALLAGCASGPRDGAPDAATSAPSASAASAAQVGACMRDRGYDVDDSQFAADDPAGAQVTVPDGVDADRWAADLVSCSGGAADAPAAQPLPGDDERRRRSAACIRDGGFADYPDDLDEQRRWQPADADAFERVAVECDRQSYETGIGTGKEARR
jgi:hypothetical protein